VANSWDSWHPEPKFASHWDRAL